VVQDPSGRELSRFTSGADGRFRVALAPGTYLLLAAPGSRLPMKPVTTTVTSGRYTTVSLAFDTGIR